MKNNTISGIEKRIPMRQEIFGSKIKIPWYFVLFLLLSSAIEAQESVLFLTWDTEVGCTDGSNDPRDGKDYFELIESNLKLRVCQRSTVTYTLHGYENSWQDVLWDVVGGEIIALSNDKLICTVFWGSGVEGTIGATILTTGDTRILPDLGIELIKKPTARFWKAPFNFAGAPGSELSGINVCAGEVFTFENGSLTNGGSALNEYHWDFGDGTTSTEFEPTHEYTQSSMSYWVTLTVTNVCNCQDSKKIQVHVGKKSVNIVCPAVVCEGQEASYSLDGLGNSQCEPFNWSVIGGVITSPLPYTRKINIVWTPSGQVNSTIDGFGYVSFNPTGCGLDCYVPTNLKIPVITDNQQFLGLGTACSNSQNRYTMPQWPTTDFVWEVINAGGTNASVILTDQRNEIILDPGTVAGPITLRVTYQNTLLNCGGTSEKIIIIKKDASISGPRETCVGEEVQYSIPGEDVVTWTLKLLPNGPTTQGTGNSLLTVFPTAGNYSLSINGATICNGEAIIIKVRSPLTPVESDIEDLDGDDSARIVCPSFPATYSISAQIPGTIVGWSVPPGVGTIVGSSYGNEIQVIWKYPTEPADTAYTLNVWRETTTNPACKSPELTINLARKILNLEIAGEPFPCGSSREDYSLPVGVFADTFEWSIDPMDAGSIVTNGGAAISVLWNQFANAQPALIKVKATKCNIPQTSAEFNQDFVVLIDNPRLTIVAPTGPICAGVSQNFSISSIPNLTSATAIEWNFGDGSLPIIGTFNDAIAVVHSFPPNNFLATNFTVSVRVTMPNGCLLTLSATTVVTVSPTPSVVVTPSVFTLCNPDAVTATLTAQTSSNVISTTWYKTGNSASIGSTETIVVNSAGVYYITVSDGICTNRADAWVLNCAPPCVVSAVPDLDLTFAQTCTTFTATATSDISGPTSVQWDSNFITDVRLLGYNFTNATFSFIEPGNHTIRYGVAYNNDNCYTYYEEDVFIPYVAKVGTAVSCGTNSYNVTITDQSLVDSSVTSLNYSFEIDNNPIPLGTNPANSRFISISGGFHIIRMTISGGGYPACTIEKSVTLPAFPNATFSVMPSPVCQENSTQFTVNNHVDGQTYLWNFGDDTSNLQQTPDKEYNLAGPYQPELYVSNAYCTAYSPGAITVLANKQAGDIVPSLIGCPGVDATLSFSSSGTPPSTTYQWLHNNVPIPGATSQQISVSNTGSYSIQVAADNQCTKRIPKSVAVAIPNPAFSSIQGPTTVCEGTAFTLFVQPGSENSGYEFEWREGSSTGGAYTTGPSVSFSYYEHGSHTYYLTVKTPLAAGGFCTSVLTHTVTVVALPEIIFANGRIELCDPFEVRLFAQANESEGVYNWSNGASGQEVSDTNGGAFQVTYTSESGCKKSSGFEVPKNPENYLWIFPYGCYTFCSEFNTGTLIGPSIAYFDKWDWLLDQGSVLSGSGLEQVAPYDLGNVDATYNLQLETRQCKVKSKPMTVEIIDCDCEIGAEIREVEQFRNPFNRYEITIYIANPAPGMQQVTVTAPNVVGVMTPSFVNVPFPGAEFTFTLLPDPGFNGGTYAIKLKTTGGDGQLCETDLEVYLPPFESIESAQNGSGEGTATAFKLRLVPNPANNQTQLYYDFGQAARLGTQVLEVYDIYGRQLESLVPEQNVASWELNTAAYQTGIYVIVMKQDGKIVQQKNLIITH